RWLRFPSRSPRVRAAPLTFRESLHRPRRRELAVGSCLAWNLREISGCQRLNRDKPIAGIGERLCVVTHIDNALGSENEMRSSLRLCVCCRTDHPLSLPYHHGSRSLDKPLSTPGTGPATSFLCRL